MANGKGRKVQGFSPEEIKIPEERQRKTFDEKAMEQLKKSLTLMGQLQPIIITRDKTLIAGHRRLIACRELEIEVQAIYQDEVDENLIFMMELDENVCRENLSPIEEIIARGRQHDILTEMFKEKNWVQEDTAKHLGLSVAQVSRDYKGYQYIKAVPDKFQNLKTKKDVDKRIKELDTQLQFNLLRVKVEGEAEEAKEERLSGVIVDPHEEAKRQGISLEEYLEKEKGKREKAKEEAKLAELPEASKSLTNEELLKRKMLEFEDRLKVGDVFKELPKVKDESINIFIMDPPWGIGLDEKVEDGKLKGEAYEDSEEAFKATFPTLCKLAYEKMAEDSHLYCFFGIIHHNFVYNSLSEAGFHVNKRPIICCKKGITSTRVPDVWPAASYEPIAFARKGQRKLILKGKPDYFEIKWLTPSQKKGHPSAKPPQAYLELLRRSALPGDIICDPTYGTGAAFVACEAMMDLSLSWFGWELDKVNKGKALLNLMDFLAKGKLVGEEEEEQNELSKYDPIVGKCEQCDNQADTSADSLYEADSKVIRLCKECAQPQLEDGIIKPLKGA